MRWLALRKTVKERLAPSVRNRVDFWRTVQRTPSTEKAIGSIVIDGTTVWAGDEWGARDGSPRYLSQAIGELLSSSVEAALSSDDHLVRALVILDARLGKRRLQTLELDEKDGLIMRFYALRAEAEGVRPSGENRIKLKSAGFDVDGAPDDSSTQT